jgi:peptide-methionine (S)-S-oxide reductase
MEEIFLAGGCLWGVQEFMRYVPGVLHTEAGRANGLTDSLDSPYDGYAECVKTQFDPLGLSISQLLGYFFQIIDPYSLNKQGPDTGPKYRTGIYSRDPEHLIVASAYIAKRSDHQKVLVEVLPLINYLPSAPEHQDRLQRYPNDYCHIPKSLLYKYRNLVLGKFK